MNINDFKDITVPEGDLLRIIFQRQAQLLEKYRIQEEEFLGHPIPPQPFDLNGRPEQIHLKDMFWRITEELGEAANCLKLKPWKSTPMTTDEAHFLEEIVDAFHFFIEMLIFIGFDPETLTKLYLQKAAVNRFRQESNY